MSSQISLWHLIQLICLFFVKCLGFFTRTRIHATAYTWLVRALHDNTARRVRIEDCFVSIKCRSFFSVYTRFMILPHVNRSQLNLMTSYLKCIEIENILVSNSLNGRLVEHKIAYLCRLNEKCITFRLRTGALVNVCKHIYCTVTPICYNSHAHENMPAGVPALYKLQSNPVNVSTRFVILNQFSPNLSILVSFEVIENWQHFHQLM